MTNRWVTAIVSAGRGGAMTAAWQLVRVELERGGGIVYTFRHRDPLTAGHYSSGVYETLRTPEPRAALQIAEWYDEAVLLG